MPKRNSKKHPPSQPKPTKRSSSEETVIRSDEQGPGPGWFAISKTTSRLTLYRSDREEVHYDLMMQVSTNITGTVLTVRGSAPVVLLDNLFIALARRLGWVIVPDAATRIFNRHSADYLFATRANSAVKSLRDHGGLFVVAPQAVRAGCAPKYRIMFYAGPLLRPAWEMIVEQDVALELATWLAEKAGWDLEDIDPRLCQH